MRISFGGSQRALLDRLSRIGKALARSTTHVASGKRVTTASEDPGAESRIASARETLARLASRRATISTVRGQVEAADAALATAGDVIISATGSAIQGYSETNAGARSLIADQVDGLRQQLLKAANTQFAGRYVFGGTETLAPPFDAAGSYLGNSGTVSARIEDQVTIQVNVAGDAVFKTPVDIPKALADLSAALRAGNTAAIGALEPKLQAAGAQISAVRPPLGFRLQALDASDLSLATRALEVTKSVAGIEDTDLAAEVTNAARLQTGSQATITVIARTRNQSLFDYIA
ncbi:MAG: hypothetical protein HY049_07695 [Acidobacteria bacterium]|nr:hypothetical protein [Acidobacteriota bacterium]